MVTLRQLTKKTFLFYYLHNACIRNIFENARIIQIKVLLINIRSLTKLKNQNQIKRGQLLAQVDLTFCLVDTLVDV